MSIKEVIILSPSKRGWRVSRLKLKMSEGGWESSFKGILTVKSRERASQMAKTISESEDTVFYTAVDSDRDVSNISRELHTQYWKETRG